MRARSGCGSAGPRAYRRPVHAEAAMVRTEGLWLAGDCRCAHARDALLYRCSKPRATPLRDAPRRHAGGLQPSASLWRFQYALRYC
jgi:hypothetical protein